MIVDRRKKKMDIAKVYKVVHVEGEGLVSVWAGIHVFKEHKQLTYKEEEITYAPEGTAGISVFGLLEDAQDFARTNTSHGFLMRIHEAIPLGKRGKGLWKVLLVKSDCTYPAILLGKEVWRATNLILAPEPKEKWVDVTEDCKLQFIVSAAGDKNGGSYIQLKHSGVVFVCFGLGGQHLSKEDDANYKVELVTPNYLSTMGTFKILKKVVK